MKMLKTLYPRLRRRFRLSAVLLLALFAAGPAAVRALEPEQPPVDLLWGVKIPLRDGVELNATVYKPGGQKEPLVVSSPNTIFLEKNYNSGGVVAAESGKDARTAHVTLVHDAAHPSALEIPIGK